MFVPTVLSLLRPLLRKPRTRSEPSRHIMAVHSCVEGAGDTSTFGCVGVARMCDPAVVSHAERTTTT
eukprot:6470137-Amphidinium_carterae.1